MKQYILYIFALVIASLSFQSCEFEASDNGDFDGNWQLMQVDTIATGGRNDVKSQQLFYSVQMKMICLYAYNADAETNMFFHFEHTSDSLKLKSARNDGKVIYSVTSLRSYGINKEEEACKVMLLNSERMQLRSDSLLLSFRKF